MFGASAGFRGCRTWRYGHDSTCDRQVGVGGVCAAVSQVLEGNAAEIEISSLDLGDQVEKEWAPMIGITYDPEDDIIDIALDDDLDHIIAEPQELIADVDDLSIRALQITDAEGTRHLVRLRDGLLLPAPH